MATYRTFMSPRQLMELLIMRYTLPRPKNRAMLEKFKQTKEIPIQLRYVACSRAFGSHSPVSLTCAAPQF